MQAHAHTNCSLPFMCAHAHCAFACLLLHNSLLLPGASSHRARRTSTMAKTGTPRLSLSSASSNTITSKPAFAAASCRYAFVCPTRPLGSKATPGRESAYKHKCMKHNCKF
ncbi:hypothetical protein T492DRAFT_975447 [Pavlovales sp. CCMP2436]|nr:hypothetical protein T492DRAFT_975447 [Pavlovales sp. CCMP2436]